MNALLKKSALATVILLALTSCKEANDTIKTEATKTEQTTSAPATTDQTATAELNITPEVEAYAVGANIADGLKHSLDSLSDIVSLDKAEILKGFQAGLDGNSTLNADQRQAALAALNQKIADGQKSAYEKLSLENKQKGDEFRANYAKEKDVVTTESGLMYKIIKAGSNVHPNESSIITVTYTGTFINGVVFDESKEITSFPLLVTIKGWQEGLPHLGLGGEMQLVIPPALGYGEDSTNLPPNSTLVFDIHLVNVEADPNNPEPQQN